MDIHPRHNAFVFFELSLLSVLLSVLSVLLVGVCTLTLVSVTSKVVLGSKFMANRAFAWSIFALCVASASLCF